jgi:hypothetical protein
MRLTQRKGEFIMATLRLLFGLLLGALLIGATAMAVPMHGTYTIGDGTPPDSFTSITAAVTALTANGVDGAVIFDVEELTYSSGSVAITQITGASETNTIIFRDAVPGGTRPVLSANATPALNLNGADYITFDGIDITLTSGTGKVVQITNNADYNTIKNCLLTGTGESGTSNYGVHILGVTGSSNDHNVIENVSVSHTVYYPVSLAGVSGTRDQGNEVRNCTLVGGRYSVNLTYQNGAVVRDCDIQPGYDGLSSAYGIRCQTLASGESSVAYGNEVHNIRGSTYGYGINAAPGSGGLFKAYNNFVYDFVVTGTGEVYALTTGSGTAEFSFNSVYIGDLVTTGNAYGFQGSGTLTVLKNNIFQIEEPQNACWAINRFSGSLTSDYNCVYSSGPGALYNMGRDGGAAGTNYATLALWQAGTAYDVNSVEGNPGFISATNLHIDPNVGLLHSGIPITGITDDIDGDPRDAAVPDIGADEYPRTPPAHDYGVTNWVGLAGTYVSNVPVVIRALVKNYGTSNETDVPVVLYYNNVAQDTDSVSLTSGQVDTAEIDWSPPMVDWELRTLVVKAFCPGDSLAGDDSIKTSVYLVGPPLAGVYDLGGGANNYATFGAAVTSLTMRGVSGPVTFNVYPLTYNETVTIGQITGASATNTITFRDVGTLDTPPEITSATSPAVNLNGADYVTFDGIDITLTVTGRVVQITNSADYNAIKNCLLTGASQTTTTNYGVIITGESNDYNVIENVTVNRTVYYPVYLWSSADQGNEVRTCTLIGGRFGVTVGNQNGAVVRDCDIQPGYDGATAEIRGISAYVVGGPSTAYANKIHNIRGAGVTNGIQATPGDGGSFRAYNNFVYDFVVTGSGALYGLQAGGSGTVEFYFNSVRIGDVGTSGNTYGFYGVSGGTSVVKNNIFQIGEPTTACWAINRAGTLTSDCNCFYGTGTAYNVGRDSTTATNYATLALWRVGTSRDLNSVEGNPGFFGPTDLHIDSLATLVDSAATPIAGITADIDGDLRDATFPDIGADEYNPLYPPSEVDSLTVFPDADAGDAILRWAPVAAANSYKVYRGTVYGFVIDGTTYIGQTASTTYTDVGVLATTGEKHYVVIASTDIIARGR